MSRSDEREKRWDEAVDNFLGHAGVEKGLAAATLEAQRHDLERLRAWATESGLSGPEAVSDSNLRAFLLASSHDLAATSRARLLSTLRSFFRFLQAEGRLKGDPTATIIAPKRGRHLPDVLGVAQVERLLEWGDASPPGLRDRAALELLYGCGCRVSELCGLDVADLDRAEAVVRLRGKGSKERQVPVGEPALAAVAAYLQGGRPHLAGQAPEPGPAAEPARRPAVARVGVVAAQEGGRGRRPAGNDFPAYAAAQLRHAPARGRGRPARGPGTAGPRRHLHHRDLHPRGPRLAGRGLAVGPSPVRAPLRPGTARAVVPLTGPMADGTVARLRPTEGARRFGSIHATS
ncbi:MAG: site-specific integrase [bacterium]|nr:site-specific integrase [bacterium]